MTWFVLKRTTKFDSPTRAGLGNIEIPCNLSGRRTPSAQLSWPSCCFWPRSSWPHPSRPSISHRGQVCSWTSILFTGLATNSILFCWLFTINHRCVIKRFFTDTKPRFASVGYGRVLRHPRPNATHLMVSLNLWSSGSNARGSLKGAVSAQKAIQGSRIETRELLRGWE